MKVLSLRSSKHPMPCYVCLGKRQPQKAAVVMTVDREATFVCKRHVRELIKKLKKVLKA